MSFDVAIVGTTASGKSGLAMEIATRLDEFEIVSVDSMQVYRGMDIGTAKATPTERAAVAHHMIDVAEPSAEMSVAEFAAASHRAVDEIHARNKRALFVGGTGLYLQSVVDRLRLPGRYPAVLTEIETEPDTVLLHQRLAGLDPLAASRMEPTNRRRVLRALEVTLGSGAPFSSFGPGIDAFPGDTGVRFLGVWLPRAVNIQRIERRIDEMLAAGWRDEVGQLQASGGISKTAAQALGYKELIELGESAGDLNEVRNEICRRTRAFARRQRMWFRRDPRIRWHAASSDPRTLLASMLRDCSFEQSVAPGQGGDDA